MAFLILLAAPALIALAYLIIGGGTVTLREFALHVAISAAVAGISMSIIYRQNVGDTEVWNGRVATKYQERVSCRHSYTCNCITTCTGGKDSSCSTSCSTCYEHANDFDWVLLTTNEERIEIDRVDRRGSKEPPRFTATQIGEPTAVAHSYMTSRTSLTVKLETARS